ncbi:MAG: hypothetical protein Q7U36_02285 [bacterium]|nr:hypothetical protein [bacterium]
MRKKIVVSLVMLVTFFLLVNKTKAAYSGKCGNNITNMPYDQSTWPSTNGMCEMGRSDAGVFPPVGGSVSWNCLGSDNSITTDDASCTGSRQAAPASNSIATIAKPKCSFTYGAASIPSGGGAFVHWNFTGAETVTFTCSNYVCNNNVCTLNPNGRTQYGENFLLSSPITSNWGDGSSVSNTWIGAGTETCTFDAKNSAGTTTCSDTLEVRPTASMVGICGDENGKVYDYDITGKDFETEDFCKSGEIGKITVENIANSGTRPPFFPNDSYDVEWSCGGNGSIEEVYCGVSRIRNTEKIDGACGEANGSYANEEIAFRSPETFCSEVQKFCARGKIMPDYSTINFPEIGKAVSWTCQGYNGGESPICTASHGIVDNTVSDCGSANGKIYEKNVEGVGTDTLCSLGNSNPISLAWVTNQQGVVKDANWSCGQGNGMKSCVAHKKIDSSCGITTGSCSQGYEIDGQTSTVEQNTTWKCKSTSWLINIFSWMANNREDCSNAVVLAEPAGSVGSVSCGNASKRDYSSTQLNVPIADGLCVNGLHGVSEPPKFGVDPERPNEATWNCINPKKPSETINCVANRMTAEEEATITLDSPNLCGPAGSKDEIATDAYYNANVNPADFRGDFCQTGSTIEGVEPPFPEMDGDATWICKNITTSETQRCYAHRNTTTMVNNSPANTETVITTNNPNNPADDVEGKCGDARGAYSSSAVAFRQPFCQVGKVELFESELYKYGAGQDWHLNGVTSFLKLIATDQPATTMQWTCIGGASTGNYPQSENNAFCKAWVGESANVSVVQLTEDATILINGAKAGKLVGSVSEVAQNVGAMNKDIKDFIAEHKDESISMANNALFGSRGEKIGEFVGKIEDLNNRVVGKIEDLFNDNQKAIYEEAGGMILFGGPGGSLLDDVRDSKLNPSNWF